MNENKKGFIPVMLTPFNEIGTVDYDSLTNLIEFYISAGATGLFANCLSSEMFELTPEERMKVTEHVVKVNCGRVPVVATATFGGKIKDQAESIKRISGLGVNATIIITNMLTSQYGSDEEFEHNADKLLKYTEGIPLGLYECPIPYKKLISHDQLLKLVRTGRVIYHKDTSLDIEQVRLKVKGTKINPNFGLYDAYVVHAVKSLDTGAAGLSCIQCNFFPELIVWLCNNYNNVNKRAEVNKVQSFLTEKMEIMHSQYPMNAKYYLKLTGANIKTFCRMSDIRELDKDTKTNLFKLKVDYENLGIA